MTYSLSCSHLPTWASKLIMWPLTLFHMGGGGGAGDGFCPPNFLDVITLVLKAVAAPNLARFPKYWWEIWSWSQIFKIGCQYHVKLRYLARAHCKTEKSYLDAHDFWLSLDFNKTYIFGKPLPRPFEWCIIWLIRWRQHFSIVSIVSLWCHTIVLGLFSQKSVYLLQVYITTQFASFNCYNS